MIDDQTKRVALIVLDGWGYRKELRHNAIAAAYTPHWDKLINQNDLSLLSASGQAVGLPKGQMGNSEVGHMHIGSGQIIEQDLVRINHACDSNEMAQKLNMKLKQINPKKIHLVGLYSDGGVHAHLSHWNKILDVLSDREVLLHPVLDGRDTSPQIALNDIKQLEKKLKNNHKHKLASLSGRFYAMDRDQRWDRTNQYLDVLTAKNDIIEVKPSDYIKLNYKNGTTDEFIKPARFNSYLFDKDDLVITLNFRPDRMVQLVDKLKTDINILCMTDYGIDLPVLFEKKVINSCLGSIFEQENLTQIRIAETEKFPHVTYFLNGGRKTKFKNEERALISSPKVTTYDQMPEMSAFEVCDKIVDAMSQGINGIFANFANADMVGHTGDFGATVKAIEAIDVCLGKIIETSQIHHYKVIITADHGNAEWMKRPENGEVVTSHTCSSVPFITNTKFKLKARGRLCDIAPTILEMLSITKPVEWDGNSLLHNASQT
ncbi:MAG: 2,3-bisphosphoglycerate-independent phosphoglycerate mutase [Pseudomonadota bacterium]|nr:2,3-bisphosphoglycerate-independent phosphoglycerate mutase [Pseudomonadota bacterium]